jgi:hypothetical protein
VPASVPYRLQFYFLSAATGGPAVLRNAWRSTPSTPSSTSDFLCLYFIYEDITIFIARDALQLHLPSSLPPDNPHRPLRFLALCLSFQKRWLRQVSQADIGLDRDKYPHIHDQSTNHSSIATEGDAFTHAMSANAAWSAYKTYQNPSFFSSQATSQKPAIRKPYSISEGPISQYIY